jgi:dienelactone hydrolase
VPTPAPAQPGFARAYYSGRAPANELARQGYAVLVHDAFSSGSRRFDLSRPTPRLAALVAAQAALWQEQGVCPTEDERFDHASALHEDTLAKAAGVLGQTLADAVLYDDLVAFEVLATAEGTDPAQLGTFGFSGGGGRSLLLSALDYRMTACVVSCMMPPSHPWCRTSWTRIPGCSTYPACGRCWTGLI